MLQPTKGIPFARKDHTLSNNVFLFSLGISFTKSSSTLPNDLLRDHLFTNLILMVCFRSFHGASPRFTVFVCHQVFFPLPSQIGPWQSCPCFRSILFRLCPGQRWALEAPQLEDHCASEVNNTLFAFFMRFLTWRSQVCKYFSVISLRSQFSRILVAYRVRHHPHSCVLQLDLASLPQFLRHKTVLGLPKARLSWPRQSFSILNNFLVDANKKHARAPNRPYPKQNVNKHLAKHGKFWFRKRENRYFSAPCFCSCFCFVCGGWGSKKIPNKLRKHVHENSRCFFASPSTWIAEPNFGDFNGFPPDSRRLSSDFDRFSVIFNQIQSVSIDFNQFQSVWLGQKRWSCLTTGRWGKNTLKKWFWKFWTYSVATEGITAIKSRNPLFPSKFPKQVCGGGAGGPVKIVSICPLAFLPLIYRVAQEPNRNRKPEPSEPFFPKPKAEPEPPEPFSRNRNRNRNRPSLLNCTETQKNPFGMLEPFHPQTVTEPNRTGASLLYSYLWAYRGQSMWCGRLLSCWVFICFAGILECSGPGTQIEDDDEHHHLASGPTSLRFFCLRLKRLRMNMMNWKGRAYTKVTKFFLVLPLLLVVLLPAQVRWCLSYPSLSFSHLGGFPFFDLFAFWGISSWGKRFTV